MLTLQEMSDGFPHQVVPGIEQTHRTHLQHVAEQPYNPVRQDWLKSHQRPAILLLPERHDLVNKMSFRQGCYTEKPCRLRKQKQRCSNTGSSSDALEMLIHQNAQPNRGHGLQSHVTPCAGTTSSCGAAHVEREGQIQKSALFKANQVISKLVDNTRWF